MTGTVTNPLNQPLDLPSGVTIKNRFLKAAMNEALGDRNGAPTQNHVRLYERWARGGAGVLLTGNVMVDPEHLGEPGNVAVQDESHMDTLRQWASTTDGTGTQLWMQINHPGKQSPRTINRHPVAPSPLPIDGQFSNYFAPPRELEVNDIHDLVTRFATTARIAKAAGFAGVEIHAAHGYLISQFLSPLHNQRTDEYGGSLENRMRFLTEVYEAVRAEVGDDFPVAVKLNSSDGVEGGFSQADSLEVAEKLSSLGVDLLEISGGTYDKPLMQGNASGADSSQAPFFLDYANELRKRVHTPVALTGGFRSVETMEQAINEDFASMVGIGRPFVLAPDLPTRIIESGRQGTIELPYITTHIPALDRALGPILANNWYEEQMYRLSQGKHATAGSGISALAFTIRHHGLAALAPRRASR